MKDMLKKHLMAVLTGLLVVLAIIIVTLVVAAPAKGLLYLAGGWGELPFDMIYVLWPIAVFAFVITFNVDCAMLRQHHYGRFARAVRFPITFTLFVWWCLPMLMNGLSSLLRIFGLESMAKIVYDLRWISLLGAIVIGFLVTTMFPEVKTGLTHLNNWWGNNKHRWIRGAKFVANFIACCSPLLSLIVIVITLESQVISRQDFKYEEVTYHVLIKEHQRLGMMHGLSFFPKELFMKDGVLMTKIGIPGGRGHPPLFSTRNANETEIEIYRHFFPS